MSSINFVTIVLCAFQLVGASRQRWGIPSCNTVPQLEGHTLTMELICENEFPEIDSLFFFFLYPTADDGRCQWNEFSRQYSTLCETSHASPQKNIQVIFEYVYSGSYCLAVYRNKLTVSLPICSFEMPFYLETELTEMDVEMWRPTITLQQQGFNDLFIQLDNSHSDGYNFSMFDIEIHAVDDSITHCDQLPVMPKTKPITVSTSGKSLTLSNLTEGNYCVEVTPVDVRCIYPFSSTNLPCTRSSNTTRITFSHRGDYQKVVVTGSVTVLLLSCLTATVIFLKKHNKAKKGKCSNRIKHRQMSSVAIFLLHSNDERLRSSVKMLKDALHARLPSCEIDDHTDEHQWESVAHEGISWFLSRLNEEEKYIIVIAPFLEGDVFNQREFSETYYFPFALQQLQSIASSSAYQRILIVWFQHDSKVECVLFRKFGNPFTNFVMPQDLDLLEQHIRNLADQDYV
ncbi:uncharacterized protein LOC130690030 [Daphnia carinata]|uniref:uncharacterized protein LOC130690030 n=1 Tax=Daphnia carinata TaxID=120202 RepID=UPI00257AB5BB|nr:uncharacterized protein LOC130690030 [Daphnia carinata]